MVRHFVQGHPPREWIERFRLDCLDPRVNFFPGLSGVTTVNKVDAAINPTGPAAGIIGTPIQVPRVV
jgi:hypothetical protein